MVVQEALCVFLSEAAQHAGARPCAGQKWSGRDAAHTRKRRGKSGSHQTRPRKRGEEKLLAPMADTLKFTRAKTFEKTP